MLASALFSSFFLRHRYYESLTIAEKNALEGAIVRKCLARNENQVCVLARVNL